MGREWVEEVDGEGVGGGGYLFIFLVFGGGLGFW